MTIYTKCAYDYTAWCYGFNHIEINRQQSLHQALRLAIFVNLSLIKQQSMWFNDKIYELQLATWFPRKSIFQLGFFDII